MGRLDPPGEFVRRIEALKSEGRRSAVFLVLAATGQTRLSALKLISAGCNGDGHH